MVPRVLLVLSLEVLSQMDLHGDGGMALFGHLSRQEKTIFGIVTADASGHTSFYINLPIGGVALGIIALFFRSPAHAKPVPASVKEILLQLDLPGATLLIGALVCFLLDMQLGGITKPWNSADVIGTLVGFGVLILAFAIMQIWRGEQASLIPRILRRRVVAGISTFVFL